MSGHYDRTSHQALLEVEPGVRLFVQDLGEGRPVVLIAGFGLDHEVWDAQVRLLAERRPDDVEPALIEAEQNGRIAARRATLATAFHRDPDPDLLAWLVRMSLRMPSWAAVACYRSMLRTDLVADMPRVKLPVLQLTGAK